eukprot:gene10013-11687_t
MAIILQIETATQTCSVALSRNGETLLVKEETAQNIHAGSLTLFIDELMKTAGFTYPQLDAIAISKGPGSYTGLRIGVSTAKGLCFALEKPLFAIDTLKMMAAGFVANNKGYNGLICPMIDARRMEVYTRVFNARLEPLSDTEAKIIDGQSFAAELQNQQVTFMGDGALKCAEVLNNENAFFSEANFNSAAYLSTLAMEAYVQQKFEDILC